MGSELRSRCAGRLLGVGLFITMIALGRSLQGVSSADWEAGC